ncbi:MAG: Peptidogalycan biosysnthesis/recognition, partial [Pseudomonadota bacterium]
MRIQVVERIDTIDGAQWDALDHQGYPFLRHAFL